jgi:hypothetical protein
MHAGPVVSGGRVFLFEGLRKNKMPALGKASLSGGPSLTEIVLWAGETLCLR